MIQTKNTELTWWGALNEQGQPVVFAKVCQRGFFKQEMLAHPQYKIWVLPFKERDAQVAREAIALALAGCVPQAVILVQVRAEPLLPEARKIVADRRQGQFNFDPPAQRKQAKDHAPPEPAPCGLSGQPQQGLET